ncbi:MAG: VOC family protein [Hyphomicrobium sp.]|jgi:predicted lactoylglutathione lyase|nr:VOC family protein [Hyphomicrobium sp.]
MQPRITLITLGVADVAVSRTFYEKLGFVASGDSNPNVTFFQAGGLVVALFGRQALAEDAGIANSKPGFSGITLAHNVTTRQEVEDVLAEAAGAGGTLIKPAQATFWGGYAGYFADPDGHLWEVAHNPFWTMDDEGRVQLPGREMS